MDTIVIGAFWQLFAQRQSLLAGVKSADHPVYDELLTALQKIDPGLYLEFCAEPGNCELIVTAEGERSLFAMVDALVAAAPVMPQWKITALKPKLGFPVTTSWEGFSVTIAEIVFDPLESSGSKDFGICIFVPHLKLEDVEDAHNALLRAIDHGLGERQFAETVQYVDVQPLPENADASKYIPLTQLEKYVQWRNTGLNK